MKNKALLLSLIHIYAYQKERLGAAMDRIGVDKMEAALFSDDLLNRKEEILAAPVKERA